MALRKRIPRIIRENKGRYIGVFILIFLGSFAFVWFRGFGNSYERLVTDFAQKNMQEDVSFCTQEPIGNISDLERTAGALIEPYRFYDAALPGEKELRLMNACARVDLPAVLSGPGLVNPGDILLSPSFYSTNGYQVGDSIEIEGKDFTVAGTAALPHYVYPLKYPNDILPASSFGIGVISADDMGRFPKAGTIYAARFTNRDALSKQVTNLYSLLQEKGHTLTDWMDAASNKRIRMAWATISGMQAMSVPVPTVLFLLCCLIVGLMIWRMVRADSVIIGTLYAQGYRRRELIHHYLSIPVMLAVAGGLVGVLLALPTIAPTIEMMAQLYYIVPYDTISTSFMDAILGILLPLCFLGLASFLVIRGELKKAPASLMKGDRQKAKVNALERAMKLDRFSFNTKFQLREQARSIPRLLFLLFGVTAASFMMLVGFTITHSMNTVFNGGTDEAYNYAWEYAFRKIKQEEAPAGTAPFNAIRCYPEGREAAEFYLNGISTDVPYVMDLVDAKGNALPQEQVNISYLLASRLKLNVGDPFTMINKLDGEAYTLTIDGIAQTYSGQFVYMPLTAFNELLGMEPGSYSGLFSDRVLDYDADELSGVKDLQDMAGAMDELMMPMTMVVVGTTIIAAIMGAIIIFLVTSLMIEESRNSISLLKVFGYRGKEVKTLILGGTAPVAVIGFLLGIPIMMGSAGALYGYLGEMINLALPMLLSPLYIAISFILIFAVFELTKLFSGRKLKNVSMSAALKAGAE